MKGIASAIQGEFPIQRVGWLNWGVALIFSLFAWLCLPLLMAKSVVIGGLIANLSYLFLKRDLQDFLQGQLLHSGRVKTANYKFFFKYYARLVALAAVLYILVSRHIVHPLGLLMGLSVVVISIGITMASVAKKFYFTAKEV